MVTLLFFLTRMVTLFDCLISQSIKIFEVNIILLQSYLPCSSIGFLLLLQLE